MLGHQTRYVARVLLGRQGQEFTLTRALKTYGSSRTMDGPSAMASSTIDERYIFPSPRSDVTILEGVSFPQYIFDKQEAFAHKTAMTNGETGQTFTHGGMRDLSLRLGSALSHLGYSRGDIVAIVSPNCPEFGISFMGLSTIGAIPSPINYAYTTGEMRYQMENGDCVAVICHADVLSTVRNACQNLPNIRHIICMSEEQDGVISLQKLLKDDGKGLPTNLTIDTREDLAVLPYSSGTTGLPKGVMLTHHNLVANLQQIQHPDIYFFEHKDNHQDVVIGVLPMYHIYGLMINMGVSLMSGANYVTLKEFNQKTYIDALKKTKPTILPLVPTLVSFMENSSDVHPEHLANVDSVLCGAAPLGETLIAKFYKKFGNRIRFMEGYGMTEASPMTHGSSKNGLVVGSCGHSVSNTLTKIVDPLTGDTMGPNEGEGELCVKGPQVMKGYFKNDKATRETVSEDGWLHTGDLATMDFEQNVFITGRLKELIKVKGLQVAPAELENLLLKHPGVKDVGVVGIPDERSGEVPKAFVVPAEGKEMVTEGELRKFIALQVAPHKRISGVEFVDDIPRSAAGKILRRILQEK